MGRMTGRLTLKIKLRRKPRLAIVATLIIVTTDTAIIGPHIGSRSRSCGRTFITTESTGIGFPGLCGSDRCVRI
jgi:hypothetical protein